MSGMNSDEYEALLLVGFGGPEAPEEVLPFLQQVTRGRNIPEERLKLVGQHYYDRGGVSPINDQCRDLIAALRAEFDRRGIDLPIHWGNRNSAPWLADAVSEMSAANVKRALALVTSAYSSYSGCRQYRENIESARAEAGEGAPQIDKLRVYFNHPGFVVPMVENTAAAIEAARAGLRERSDLADAVAVLFTAHSIPTSMATTCAYERQLRSVVDVISAEIDDMPPARLVWQSRSGPPQMPWLEPDICDAIDDLGAAGEVGAVVVVPIGFISDHMEVMQDLDTDARAAADRHRLVFARAGTVGTDPRFVAGLVDLVEERISGRPPESVGSLGLMPEQCAPDCCPAPQRPTGRPAR